MKPAASEISRNLPLVQFQTVSSCHFRLQRRGHAKFADAPGCNMAVGPFINWSAELPHSESDSSGSVCSRPLTLSMERSSMPKIKEQAEIKEAKVKTREKL